MNKIFNDTIANILLIGGSALLVATNIYESRKRSKVQKKLEWYKSEAEVYKEIYKEMNDLHMAVLKDLDKVMNEKDQTIKVLRQELRKNMES